MLYFNCEDCSKKISQKAVWFIQGKYVCVDCRKKIYERILQSNPEMKRPEGMGVNR